MVTTTAANTDSGRIVFAALTTDLTTASMMLLIVQQTVAAVASRSSFGSVGRTGAGTSEPQRFTGSKRTAFSAPLCSTFKWTSQSSHCHHHHDWLTQ